MNETYEDRFWAKVTATGFCWEWTAARMPNGYGVFNLGKLGGTKLAHRVSYELLVGAVQASFQIDHLCRNRCCVNPDHLEPVSQKENLLRGFGFGGVNSRKTHCVRGHDLSIYAYEPPTRPGMRHCRKCTAIHHRREKQDVQI